MPLRARFGEPERRAIGLVGMTIAVRATIDFPYIMSYVPQQPLRGIKLLARGAKEYANVMLQIQQIDEQLGQMLVLFILNTVCNVRKAKDVVSKERYFY